MLHILILVHYIYLFIIRVQITTSFKLGKEYIKLTSIIIIYINYCHTNFYCLLISVGRSSRIYDRLRNMKIMFRIY